MAKQLGHKEFNAIAAILAGMMGEQPTKAQVLSFAHMGLRNMGYDTETSFDMVHGEGATQDMISSLIAD